MRCGVWKLKLDTTPGDEDIYHWGQRNRDTKIREASYNLATDPGEQKSVFSDHPNIVVPIARWLRSRGRIWRTNAWAGKSIRPLARVGWPKRSRSSSNYSKALSLAYMVFRGFTASGQQFYVILLN